MKHFSAQTGGRFTYVDDVINLQELALAINSIFTDCDNFIVSGCEIDGNSISNGYVYINGELRFFQGANNITQWPRYIYEQNSIETVAYANGTDKVGRTVYGCGFGTAVPTSLDPVTNAIPGSIKITSEGGLRIKEALFGKYALLLDPSSGQQEINGAVRFQNDISVTTALSANNVKAVSGNNVGQMYWNDGNFIVQAGTNKFVITSGGEFKFYTGSTLIFTISSSGIVNSKPVSSGSGNVMGNISITGNAIYDSATGSNSGHVDINVIGYNGSSSYYRNTYIGNGKGSNIISVTGSSSKVDINGVLSVSSPDTAGFVLKSTLSKSNDSLKKSISFQDSSNYEMAYIGYVTNSSKLFTIKNNLSDIKITGSSCVDLGPAIKENGQLLSSKYVLATTLAELMLGKADAGLFYTKGQVDETFATKTSGLAQFLSETTTKAVLRNQIGAYGADEVKGICPTLSNLLADMASTEAKKTQIRQNIGAAAAGQYEPTQDDSDWVKIDGTLGLYVRQKGSIVCIQGRIITGTGNIFTLPVGIGAPAYDVAFCAEPNHDTRYLWTAKIPGGQKVCSVTSPGNADTGLIIPFSLTYMTEE